MKEIWTKTYLSEMYEVSNLGRVRSVGRYVHNSPTSERFLKPRLLEPKKPNSNGYLRINISKENKKKTIQIHQLVYHSFNSTSPKKHMVVDHIDGNKLNNRLSNLQFITHTQNCEKGKRHTDRAIKLPLNIVASDTDTSKGYGITKMINKKQTWFGRYSTLEEALCRRDELIKKNWIE